MKKICIALLFSLTSLLAFSQIEALHINAGWNETNNIEWFNKLKDCDISELLIEDDNNQAKYKIASVPTIIILDDGEEVKRFQADLSFKMVSTKKEIQEYIDELIISKF